MEAFVAIAVVLNKEFTVIVTAIVYQKLILPV